MLQSRELEARSLIYEAILEFLDQPSVAAFAALPEEARSKKWEELFEECDGLFLDDFYLIYTKSTILNVSTSLNCSISTLDTAHWKGG